MCLNYINISNRMLRYWYGFKYVSNPLNSSHQQVKSNPAPTEYGVASVTRFLKRIWSRCASAIKSNTTCTWFSLSWDMCLGSPEPTCKKSCHLDATMLERSYGRLHRDIKKNPRSPSFLNCRCRSLPSLGTRHLIPASRLTASLCDTKRIQNKQSQPRLSVFLSRINIIILGY